MWVWQQGSQSTASSGGGAIRTPNTLLKGGKGGGSMHRPCKSVLSHSAEYSWEAGTIFSGPLIQFKTTIFHSNTQLPVLCCHSFQSFLLSQHKQIIFSPLIYIQLAKYTFTLFFICHFDVSPNTYLIWAI